jgi:hypothetical protein
MRGCDQAGLVGPLLLGAMTEGEAMALLDHRPDAALI